MARFSRGRVILLYNISEIGLRLIDNIIINPAIYCLRMIFGWIAVRCVSIIIAKCELLRCSLSYLGKNAIVVLCVHFATFRIIALLQCIWLNLPLSQVSAFPVVRGMGIW